MPELTLDVARRAYQAGTERVALAERLLAIAKLCRRDGILAMRRLGLSWDQIAAETDLDLAELVSILAEEGTPAPKAR